MLSREVIWLPHCNMGIIQALSSPAIYLLLDRLTKDIVSGSMLALHRSIARTGRGLRILYPHCWPS